MIRMVSEIEQEKEDLREEGRSDIEDMFTEGEMDEARLEAKDEGREEGEESGHDYGYSAGWDDAVCEMYSEEAKDEAVDEAVREACDELRDDLEIEKGDALIELREKHETELEELREELTGEK